MAFTRSGVRLPSAPQLPNQKTYMQIIILIALGVLAVILFRISNQKKRELQNRRLAILSRIQERATSHSEKHPLS